MARRFAHRRDSATACFSLAFNGAEGDTRRIGGGVVLGTAPVLAWLEEPLATVPAEAEAAAEAFAWIAGTCVACACAREGRLTSRMIPSACFMELPPGS